MSAMAWGSKQQETQDRPVIIDGHTGKVIDTDRNDQSHSTDRGGRQQDGGSARFIYDDHGRPTPYVPNSEF